MGWLKTLSLTKDLLIDRMPHSTDVRESSVADVLVEDPLSLTAGVVKGSFSSTQDPLSPTDYTLQVDDDEEELNRLDTLS